MARRARIKWYGKTVRAEVRRKAAGRLNQAAEFLRGQIVRNISTSTRQYGPSAVGEFPHVDTGKLRQSIFATRATESDPSCIVGTNLVYGRVHEIKRSFLRRTLYENLARLRRIVLRGRGQGGFGAE